MKISVVIPAYNEAPNILVLAERLDAVLRQEGDYELIFVDDGSSDSTLLVLKELHAQMPQVEYLSFSRNFGHQLALKAGIDYATGDCVITMDADLQHPPNLIPTLLEKWRAGYDIVYTQRLEEKGISLFKKLSSRLFYKSMNALSDVNIEPGTADFRLMDKQVVAVFRQVNEFNPFIRGFVAWMGFKQYKITYQAQERYAGKSKYSFTKMMSFALHGITSFSIKPLRFSIILGSIISSLAFVYGLYAIYISLFTDKAVAGWASTLVSVLFIGGIQLFILGVIGEYLGKLFIQSKNRPTYIIREKSLQ